MSLTHSELTLEVVLLRDGLHQALLDVAAAGALRLELQVEVVLLLEQLDVLHLQLLAQLLLLLKGLVLLLQLLLQRLQLVLDAGHIEQRLHLRVQLPPEPVAQREELAQVALDDQQGDALVLQLLEGLLDEVPANPGLHPGDDLRQALIAHLLQTTQHTGAEEDLLDRW